MRSLIFIVVAIASPAIGSADELTAEQQLIDACYRLNQYRVVRLLRDGVNVNAPYGRSDQLRYRPEWTPLLALAQSYWQTEPARWQRSAADPKSIANKRIAILRVLLSHGCDVDASDSTGETALHSSIRNRDVEFAKLLLLFEPNVDTWAKGDNSSRESPLHSAHWSVELSELLLNRGATATVSEDYRVVAAKADYLQQFSIFFKLHGRMPTESENRELGFDPAFDSVLTPYERIAKDLDFGQNEP